MRCGIIEKNHPILSVGAQCRLLSISGSSFYYELTGETATRISMDGKGWCIDTIFIERLWRSLEYERVYLHAWEAGSQANAGIGAWITPYNHQRPQAAHGGQLPAVVYFNSIETD